MVQDAQGRPHTHEVLVGAHCSKDLSALCIRQSGIVHPKGDRSACLCGAIGAGGVLSGGGRESNPPDEDRSPHWF